MKRKIQSENIRNSILHTARKLFMEQGYHSTTIRQITGECDIKIGTLYHFYKDKEEIFLCIVEKIFDSSVNLADLGVDADDSCIRFVKVVLRHFDLILRDEQSRELYLVSYSSLSISKKITAKSVERNKMLFQKYNPDFNDEDFLIKSLMVNGLLFAITISKSNGGIENDNSIIFKSIKSMLKLYNIPQTEMKRTLDFVRMALI